MGFWRNLRLPLHIVCCFKLTKPERVVTTACESSIRPWADLPPELLSLIVDVLGLKDLLSFRGVCKSWSAATTASLATARAGSKPCPKPWLLVHGDGIDKSRCLLLDSKRGKHYITIPEMEGATCIASNQGWLLLAKEDSVFFFCPFSRSRIDLPPLPLKLSQLSDHVAAFSSLPTSDNCIVSVPNRNKASGLELFLLSRTDETWDKHALGYTNEQLGILNCATFCEDGKFWFQDKGSGCATFDPLNKEGMIYRVVAPYRANPDTVIIPFRCSKRGIKTCKKQIMDWLGGPGNGHGNAVSVSTCGTMAQRAGKVNQYVQNETEDPKRPCSSSSRLKGIWLQPRFFEVPQHQSWTLSG